MGQLNEFQCMKTLRATLLLWCFFLLPEQFLHAAPPSGQVIGWGGNTSGEATGIPSFPFSNGMVVTTGSPSATGAVTIAGHLLSNVVAISAGSAHSLALCSDGTVAGFGGNFLGQATGSTNDYPYRASAQVRIGGRILSNVVSIIASRTFSLALKEDGTVVTWGENYVPAGLTNIAAIAAEWGSSWALKRDGTVVGWTSQPSSDDYGQLLTVENLSNVVAIVVGPGGYTRRGVALKNDGTVGIWGGESAGKDAAPSGLSGVVAVAAGDGQTLALKSDSTVIGWGFNNVGQATGTPTTNSPNISAGQVRIGGQVLSNVVSIAAGRGYSLALKRDGTVIAWGRRMVNDLHPVTVPAGLSNVVAISAGDNFCLAITTNRAVADRFRQ
jgi:alpha-tubulin suppressor-like RCC1 family protein